MTDLVERLRKLAGPSKMAGSAAMREAANEIERLRANLIEAEKYNSWHQEAILEIERLRGLCDDITHDNEILILKIMEFEPQWKL